MTDAELLHLLETGEFPAGADEGLRIAMLVAMQRLADPDPWLDEPADAEVEEAFRLALEGPAEPF